MSEARGWASWKRPLLIVLATAPLAVIALSMVLMARSTVAFDEDRCPYQEGQTRSVSEGVSVREDARNCQPGVEERRWVLLREGEEPLELGRRRLSESGFEGYTWTATEEDERVRIEVQTPGLDPRIFREPSPDAGAAVPQSPQ